MSTSDGEDGGFSPLENLLNNVCNKRSNVGKILLFCVEVYRKTFEILVKLNTEVFISSNSSAK